MTVQVQDHKTYPNATRKPEDKSLQPLRPTSDDVWCRDEDTDARTGPPIKVAQDAMERAMLGVSLKDHIRLKRCLSKYLSLREEMVEQREAHDAERREQEAAQVRSR
ncbi:unnamed protein product [Plutella xylostella]|uniref:(diamondback moth) hypothetical protein n=1 Tax=Plutella xylostella TaxID=51655 RepID=A0A8S4FXU2_PLUXY|nr:unnamed protein product [Plutella xylostella]